MEHHAIIPANLHITHIGRSRKLMEEAVEIARRGCFVDLDLWERDFHIWFKVFTELNGPMDQLTVSSDAGQGAPAEIWYELRNFALKENVPIERLLPLVTTNTSKALRLRRKGRIEPGLDADLAVFDAKSLDMKHVISQGRLLMKDGAFNFGEAPNNARREFDIYGSRKEKT
ncbi:isoaspartyl dipeptidase [compost metagenome]